VVLPPDRPALQSEWPALLLFEFVADDFYRRRGRGSIVVYRGDRKAPKSSDSRRESRRRSIKTSLSFVSIVVMLEGKSNVIVFAIERK
jgi:hypothetical protein